MLIHTLARNVATSLVLKFKIIKVCGFYSNDNRCTEEEVYLDMKHSLLRSNHRLTISDYKKTLPPK